MENKNGIVKMIIFGVIAIAIALVAWLVISLITGKDDYKKGESNVVLSLETTSGNTYLDGEEVEVSISGSNYGTLACSSSNTKFANCYINDSTLVIVPGEEAGTAIITITESNENVQTEYEVTNIDEASSVVTLSLSSKSGSIYVNGGYLTSEISGSNYGTLTCLSSNTSVAKCSVRGKTLTVTPVSAGTATITIKESNENKTIKYTATIKDVELSTSLSLTSKSGSAYVGSADLTSTIKGSNYGTLTCSSSNTTVASCNISGSTLKVTPKAAGSATITVKESNKNKTVTYTITVLEKVVVEEEVSLLLSSTSGVTSVNGSILTSTISGINYGNLTCTSSNTRIAKCSVEGNELIITPGTTAGNATITVKESKKNKTVKYTMTNEDITISLSVNAGTTNVGGSNLMATIFGNHYGVLTCTSSNKNVATCSIDGTTLTITPGKNAGSATITVRESNKNKTVKYTVTSEDVELSLSASSGTTKVGGENLTVEISGKYFGALSCTSSNTKVATCSVSGTALTITPGTVGGSATITVKESLKSKSVKYIVTNEGVTLSLSSTSGITYFRGKSLSVTISGKNYGELTCTSSNTSVATCSIDGTTLKISPNYVVGNATITVKESNTNKSVSYKVIVKKEYECYEGNLTYHRNKGYICVMDAYFGYTEVCNQSQSILQGEPYIFCNDDNITSTNYDETVITTCTNNKITDESFGCYNQYLCTLTIVEHVCLDSEWKYAYYCPSGWGTYSGSDSNLTCYQDASLKR